MINETNTLKHIKVFIFGAGQAGLKALENLDKSVKVLGFIDNNEDKLGSIVAGHKVYSPGYLAAVEFDRVLIASEYFEQINQQLVECFNIQPDMITVLPARMQKGRAFGDSSQVNNNALDVLFTVTNCLNYESVNYYVDAGTLLGIYRDGQLIPWDDDLDLAINAADLIQVKNALNKAVLSLRDKSGIPWVIVEHYEKKGYGAVPKGAVRALQLKTQTANSAFPIMDIFIKYIQGDIMDYSLASRSIRMPSKHILNTETTEFKGEPIRIPGDVEGYLSSHYGDWQTPVKNWNLSMLQNATLFNEN